MNLKDFLMKQHLQWAFVIWLCSYFLSSCSAVVGGLAGGLIGGAAPVIASQVADNTTKIKKNAKRKKVTPLPPATLTEEEQRRFDYFFLEAVRLKNNKQYDAAFGLLQHCLAIAPDASSALYELSQYYIYLKQPQQALALLERAVANAPDNYWYAQGLANLYMQRNETEKATVLLEDMTLRFADKLEPLYNLLDIYNHAEQYDNVIDILNRLENRMGKNEQLSMEKFRIYLQKKDDKAAFREIENLVSEYPMDMRYRVVLGDVYLQHGKADEAYAIYRQVLEDEPDNAMALYSLASYYEETGQTELYEQQLDTLLLNKKVPSDAKLDVMRRFVVRNEQAGRDSTQVITLFDRIMEQEPDDPALPLLYAQYLLSKGMDQKAYPVLGQVLEIDPTNTAARMTLLGEAIRKEDYQEVTRLCEIGVESNPDMLEFYFYLAIAYNQAERTEDALAVSRKALTHVTKESKKEVVSDFYTIIGDACHSLNRNDEAYEAYDEALQYNPGNIPALNNYAYYLSVERKNLDKAEEMSYKTVKAEPDNATYLDTYAWILFEKGNYAEARLYIDNAIKSDQDKSAVIMEHCGDIYYMTGDVEAAVGYWKQALEMGGTSALLKEKIAKRKYISE